jgi:hypothetical protein
MVSDQLELSFRYSYSGGRPYTPKVYDFHHRVWNIDSDADYNTERFDYYSRLDIMLLRRFNFKHINLTTFLDFRMFLIEIMSGKEYTWMMERMKCHISINKYQ